jgi:3-methyladenine DNA glycosylase AlkD
VWLAVRPAIDRRALAATVRALWDQPVHEARALAVLLLEERHDRLTSVDLALLEDVLRRSGSWAYVDALAVHVVGPLVEREPALLRTLDRWVQDDDFWMRRAAMLALLLPLRRGAGDWTRFTRYADLLLDEREFFVRKAIGWVLREHGKRRPERVEAFLTPRATRASGVTWREALKHLPAENRARLETRRVC